MTVRTQTQECPVHQAPVEYRVLRLQLTPMQRLQALVGKMRVAAEALPPEHQTRILQTLADWEANFFQKYRLDSPLDVAREAAAHALLFLKFSLIEQHIIGCARRDVEKVKWVALSNDIRAIVAAILPPQFEINAFILADENKQLEVRARLKTAQTVREVMPAILANYARTEERYYQLANQAGAELHNQSQETQGQMASLNTERALAITQLHGEFDALTADITEIARGLEGQLHSAQDFGQKINVQEGVLFQALNECEAVIRKA